MAPNSSTKPPALGGGAGTTLANTGALVAGAVDGDRSNQTYAADGAMPILLATLTTPQENRDAQND